MATIHHIETPSGWTHQAAPQDDRESSFGEWLTQARTARGLTLDDIKEAEDALKKLLKKGGSR